MARTSRAACGQLGCALALSMLCMNVAAQRAPTAAEAARYSGMHAAALEGNLRKLSALLEAGVLADQRDPHGRTPLHVAAYTADIEAMRTLVTAGANPNAMDRERYDILTIAAVAGNLEVVEAALRLGANAANVTSPYEGTALIAAAHLGHTEVVKRLIDAGAPVDHVNNLGWTALIESIVLGDGGKDHTGTLEALIRGGADVNLPDGEGRTPLQLARARGYTAMAALLKAAGARE